MDFDLVFLGIQVDADASPGTNGAARAQGRRAPALRLCGGTQRQLLRSSVGLIELREIFLALPRRASVSGNAEDVRARGRELPLTVGPPGHDLFGSLRRIFGP